MSRRRRNPDVMAVAELGLIAGLAYFGYQIFQKMAASVSPTTADNGQPLCTTTDLSSGNCISANAVNACSALEYATSTGCYRGAPPHQTCTLDDWWSGNCLSGDGIHACGWEEFWTATSCYKGQPA